MTFEEIIYDVLEIKSALEDDTDLDELWILRKINNYRAELIKSQYAMEPHLNPEWLQQVEKFSFVKTNASDDPSITYNSITLGKATLPAVVWLPYDLGMYRLSASGGINQFEPTDFDTLVMKALIKEDMGMGRAYYARVGREAYVYPYFMEGKAIIIADDPFSVDIQENGVFRAHQMSDPYPLDSNLAQMAILKLLTQDLRLNEESISDVVNDAQSNLRIMKDERKTG